MNSVALIVGGVLLGWFVEWLYVYVTKTAPKKDEVKQLKAALRDGEQSQSEVTTKMSAEIEALKAQVVELTTQNEAAVAEAEGLREELAVVQQSIEVEQSGSEEELGDAAEASRLDADVKLEEEFTQAMEAELAEPEVRPEAGTATETDDDMCQLTGVGPKTATLLNEAGLVSFAQLAAMDAESLQDFLQTNNIPHSKAKVVSWPEQAGQLMK